MNNMHYKIILSDKLENRYIIIDENNKIIDDANGYGYKTKENANKVAYWKFKGGKENQEEIYKKFFEWFSIENNKKFFQSYMRKLEDWWKELYYGDTTTKDLYLSLKKELNQEVSEDIEKFIISGKTDDAFKWRKKNKKK